MKRNTSNICPVCDAGDPTSVITSCDCGSATLTPQEHILAARRRNDWAWQYHQCMTATDHTAFDAWLVAYSYPLAFEPGTTEIRFRRMVQGSK